MCVLCDSASWCCISSRKTVDALRTALSNRSDSLIFNRLSHDPRGGLVDVFVRLLGRGCFAQMCASKASPTSLEGVWVLPIKRGFGRTQPQTVHAQPSN